MHCHLTKASQNVDIKCERGRGKERGKQRLNSLSLAKRERELLGLEWL
jgi:hypothetical protein